MLLASGCATVDPDDPYAKTKQDAIIGAAVGAGIGVYMDRQQRELEEIEGAEVERVDEETLRVIFDNDILFAVDSATLAPEARRQLDEFARVMNEYPKTAILVRGKS